MDLNKNQAEAIFKMKAGQASGAETARKEYEEKLPPFANEQRS